MRRQRSCARTGHWKSGKRLPFMESVRDWVWFWWSRLTTPKIVRQEKMSQNVLWIKNKKKETVDTNIQRTLSCQWELLRVNERLRRLNDASNTPSPKKKKIQKKLLQKQHWERELAQESLRKALQNKRRESCRPSLAFWGGPFRSGWGLRRANHQRHQWNVGGSPQLHKTFHRQEQQRSWGYGRGQRHWLVTSMITK